MSIRKWNRSETNNPDYSPAERQKACSAMTTSLNLHQLARSEDAPLGGRIPSCLGQIQVSSEANLDGAITYSPLREAYVNGTATALGEIKFDHPYNSFVFDYYTDPEFWSAFQTTEGAHQNVADESYLSSAMASTDIHGGHFQDSCDNLERSSKAWSRQLGLLSGRDSQRHNVEKHLDYMSFNGNNGLPLLSTQSTPLQSFSSFPALEHRKGFPPSSPTNSPQHYPESPLLFQSSVFGTTAPTFPLSSDRTSEFGDVESPSTVPGSRETSSADAPYAKLIYKALMSAPNHAMVLQEIYRWFIENTDKGSASTSGWKNSIRHNLSMNAAFRKTERKNTGDEAKKSTEWVLEPFAIEDGGVQSTTRYRKIVPSGHSNSAIANNSANDAGTGGGGSGVRKGVRPELATKPSRRAGGRRGGGGLKPSQQLLRSRILPPRQQQQQHHHHHHQHQQQQQQQRRHDKKHLRHPVSARVPRHHHPSGVKRELLERAGAIVGGGGGIASRRGGAPSPASPRSYALKRRRSTPPTTPTPRSSATVRALATVPTTATAPADANANANAPPFHVRGGGDGGSGGSGCSPRGGQKDAGGIDNETDDNTLLLDGGTRGACGLSAVVGVMGADAFPLFCHRGQQQQQLHQQRQQHYYYGGDGEENDCRDNYGAGAKMAGAGAGSTLAGALGFGSSTTTTTTSTHHPLLLQRETHRL